MSSNPQIPKPTGKKRKRLSQKEQSQRFVDKAKELEIGDEDTDFESAVDKILDSNPKRVESKKLSDSNR